MQTEALNNLGRKIAVAYYLTACGMFLVCLIFVFFQLVIIIGENIVAIVVMCCKRVDEPALQIPVQALTEIQNIPNPRTENKLLRIILHLNGNEIYPNVMPRRNRECNYQFIWIVHLILICMCMYIIWNNIAFCIIISNDVQLPPIPFTGHTLYNITSNYSFI